MKNLYNNDGTLSIEAQFLLSPKPDELSIKEWRKSLKYFRSELCEEDLKKFKTLRRITKAKFYRKTNNKNWSKTYYQKNREKILAKERLHGKEKRKATYQKRREKALIYRKNYYETNKEKIKEKRKEYKRKERHTVQDKLRRAVHSAFARIKKDKPTNTLELLGCTWEEAKAHIEALWQEGMTWENHGTYGWHIDHIRPVSSFKEDELHLMNRIENLQPLWWQDNLSKSDNWKE